MKHDQICTHLGAAGESRVKANVVRLCAYASTTVSGFTIDELFDHTCFVDLEYSEWPGAISVLPRDCTCKEAFNIDYGPCLPWLSSCLWYLRPQRLSANVTVPKSIIADMLNRELQPCGNVWSAACAN